jgi:hypothetical protein
LGPADGSPEAKVKEMSVLQPMVGSGDTPLTKVAGCPVALRARAEVRKQFWAIENRCLAVTPGKYC